MIQSASKQIPVVRSGNMSLGVNLLCTLVEAGATALKNRGYDVEIIERHHRKKVDARAERHSCWEKRWQRL